MEWEEYKEKQCLKGETTESLRGKPTKRHRNLTKTGREQANYEGKSSVATPRFITTGRT